MYKKELDLFKIRVKDFFKDYDKDFVVQYIKGYCRKDYNKMLLGANLMLKDSFTFDNTWDMEPCKIPYCVKPFKWDYTPNGDEEWIFMLNRHEYLNKLLIAYYVEEEEIYLNKLKYFLFNWIDTNKITIEGGNTIRTIDTGIRCMCWIDILMHLVHEKKISDAEIVKIVLSIKEQIEYLRTTYIGKYTLSNWGVLQTTTICSAFLWMGEFFKDKSLSEWAINELYEQIDIQVFEDGSHWEQSVMYHVEVLNCCMKFINHAQILNVKLNQEFINKIEKMAEYLMYCATPKSTQEAQGDSDITDVRDVLVKASVLFNNGLFKNNAFNNMDLSSICILGNSGYEKYQRINKIEPKELNKLFKDSGNIYLRSSFKEDASYTYMKNGTLGSSHGHTDLSHISIYHKGKPFMVDCGRYTYVENNPLREYLKSAKAHNVCVIDGDPHGKPIKSWKYSSYGDCLKNYFVTKGDLSYIEMPYTAMLQDGTPYFINRKVLYIAPAIWVIINDIKCNGNHSIEEYFNLDNSVKVIKEEGQVILRNCEAVLKVTSKELFIINNGVLSKEYNTINNNKKLIKKVKLHNENINYDIIIDEKILINDVEIKQFNNSSMLDDDLVIAKEFIISVDESYIVFIFNKETFKGAKLYYYKDIPLYGKSIVIHRKGNKYKKTRLKV